MSAEPADDEDIEARGRRLVEEVASAYASRNLDTDVTAEHVAALATPAVAYLWDRRDSALQQLLTRLRGIRGLAKPVDQLKRYLEDVVKRARRVAADPGDVGGALVSVAIGAPNDWPAYSTPSGWAADERGIWSLQPDDGELRRVLVAEDPLMVTAVRRDVGTGRESLVLGWRRHGRWVEAAMPREHARSARSLVEYAGQGLPVSASNSRDLEQWLVGCERSGRAALPVQEVTTRTGWQGDIFIAGPDGAIELEDPDGDREGWRASGTWEGWLDALDVVDTDPAPQLILRAACVGPLMPWLRLGHNPIYDLYGPRGRGKTTCERLAGSVYGRPDDGHGGTILTWDASHTHLERIAARSWHTVLLVDDTKRARRPGDVTAALYSLAQGRGRGRGTPGGVQRTATWHVPVITTGEAPLVEATEAGGARARVLSIGITPAIRSLAAAKALEAGIFAHHGHLGIRVAGRARELGDELGRRYQVSLARWARDVPADTRLLSAVAAVEVADSVLREVGVPEPECDWRAALRDALTESVVAADQASRALDLVREELARHGGAYLGREAVDRQGVPVEPAGGYRGIWRENDSWVGIYPTVLHRLLEDAGHDVSPVLALWVERGVLETGRGNQREVGFSDGGRKWKQRVYAFRRSHVLE